MIGQYTGNITKSTVDVEDEKCINAFRDFKSHRSSHRSKLETQTLLQIGQNKE